MYLHLATLKKINARSFVWLTVFVTIAQHATAGDIDNAQTGYSGLLRIPSAEVVNYGEVALSHTWEDNVDRQTPYNQGAHHTALLNIGLIPNLEISLQNAYQSINGRAPGYNQGGGSDLAFSTKYNVSHLLPDIGLLLAIGVQDFSMRDNANLHTNRYVVGTVPFDNFEFTLGYGQGDKNNQMGEDFLQGPFAGLTYRIHPNLSLITEYDGTGVNAGFSANYEPQFLPAGWRTNLKLQLYSNSNTKDRDNRYAALGITMPLGYDKSALRNMVVPKHDTAQTHKIQHEVHTSSSASSLSSQDNTNNSTAYTASRSNADLQNHTHDQPLSAYTHPTNQASNNPDGMIIQSLRQQGFENLRMVSVEGLRLVFLENNFYKKSQARGLAEAIKTLIKYTNEPIGMVLTHNNQAIIYAHINTPNFKHPANQLAFDSSITFSYPDKQLKTMALQLNDTYASSRFKPKLELSPYLLSTLGTEFGVFDYTLGLASNLRMPLWRGGMLDVRHITDLDQSNDVGFYGHPLQPINTGVDRILLHQTWIPTANLATQFSAGIIKTDLVGINNETQWRSGSGQHKVFANIAKYEHKDTNANYNIQKLGYRYYLPSYKHALVASAGRVNDTKALNFALQNWYGDIRADIAIEKILDGETYAGLVFKLPLDFDHATHPRHGIQFSGVPEWSWGYDTQVSNKNNIVSNRVSAHSFDLQYNLDLQYDRDRLSPGYLEAQLPYIYGIIFENK